MNRVLLADFGSTRIKLLLWDRCTGLVDREERPGAVPIRSDGGRFETSPEFYWRTLESAVGELFRRSAAQGSGHKAHNHQRQGGAAHYGSRKHPSVIIKNAPPLHQPYRNGHKKEDQMLQ